MTSLTTVLYCLTNMVQKTDFGERVVTNKLISPKMHHTMVVKQRVSLLYGKRTPDLCFSCFLLTIHDVTVSTPQLIICSKNPYSQYHQFPISALIFIEENVPLAIIKHFPRLVCRKLIRKMTVTQCQQSDRERRKDSIDSTSMACIISDACLSLYLHV